MTALRAFAVGALAALFVAIVAPGVFANPSWPYTGVKYAHGSALTGPLVVSVDANSPAYRAGLRTGDAVACLSASDADELFPFVPAHLQYTGRPVKLCAKRNGIWRDLVIFPQRRPPAGLIYGTPALAALRLAVFLVFVVVGGVLVLARPGLMTWLLFGYCLANAPWGAVAGTLQWLPPRLYMAAVVFVQAILSAGVGFLMLFALIVPEDRPPAGWRRTAFVVAAGLTVATAAVGVLAIVRGDIGDGSIIWPLNRALTVATVLVVFGRLATMGKAERARFGWAAFAIVFGVVANDLRTVPTAVFSNLAGVLTVVMPLALMYAILRRHVIDVRFVISRTVVYGIITTLVAGIIALVDWATNAYLNQARAALAIDALVTIAIGLALHRIYNVVESVVDSVLFRRKHDAQKYLDRLSRSLLQAERESTVDRGLTEDPSEKLDLTMAALFRRDGAAFVLARAVGWNPGQAIAFENEHDLVRFLAAERSRVEIRDLRRHVAARFIEAGALPAVAVPILLGSDLAAFALYGLHRDGTRLDPDEIDALERLCERGAQAYMSIENARYHALAESRLLRPSAGVGSLGVDVV
jgi:hypothetical protein